MACIVNKMSIFTICSPVRIQRQIRKQCLQLVRGQTLQSQEQITTKLRACGLFWNRSVALRTSSCYRSLPGDCRALLLEGSSQQHSSSSTGDIPAVVCRGLGHPPCPRGHAALLL